MDEETDPIYQFFTPSELESPYALYTALSLPTPPSSATKQEVESHVSSIGASDIRSAYRRAALKCHPDKHASKSEEDRKELEKQFQKVGFAFAVLSDDTRRKRYDTTGRTTESSGAMFDDAAAMGSWEAYFSAMYQKVDKKMLDEDKKRYQRSEEEISDLHTAYTEGRGSLPHIMAHIPHSTPSDEPRFIDLINTAIKEGILEPEADWEKSSKDQKAKKERVKKAKKEEKEAEAAARELGVWDEFYGNGKNMETKASTTTSDEPTSKRGTKRKSTAATSNGGDEADATSGLAAIIAKRQQSRASAFDALLTKYGGGDAADDEVLDFSGKKKQGKGSKSKTPSNKKGKKNGKSDETTHDETVEGDMPTEEEFQRLQEKLFKK
ncbi:hypothetical protein QFC19_002822 [Naganishia cerealis]|uniref:Uncharacterized protein n=1 Tax=Naganishia cerealis TaxID=610337 RepID=A0ACC2W984_9TREE|nr:hypothetical protein QFC19_002822 [Naganishia cerealis]